LKKKALIIGITGQDGAYLAQYLLDLDYEVHGAVRRTSTGNLSRLSKLDILDKVKLIDFDLLDAGSISNLLNGNYFYDEVYNLAAQSFVQASFNQPYTTCDVDGMGVLRLLEATRMYDLDHRFYQASSSEMFGKVREMPQNELTPFHPRSPYGVAKAFAHYLVQNYRESFNIFACSGILFNHESPLRGSEFVTKKIVHGLYNYFNNDGLILQLGNLDARRDWGHAKDYVRAMHLMVNAKEARDYVVSSGETHSVQEFVAVAAKFLGHELEWEGDDLTKIARCPNTGRIVVEVNPKFFRPAEVDVLLGDSSKIRKELGWKPEYTFYSLVEDMVKAEYDN